MEDNKRLAERARAVIAKYEAGEIDQLFVLGIEECGNEECVVHGVQSGDAKGVIAAIHALVRWTECCGDPACPAERLKEAVIASESAEPGSRRALH
jgi:hypothetical protein